MLAKCSSEKCYSYRRSDTKHMLSNAVQPTAPFYWDTVYTATEETKEDKKEGKR